MTNRREPGGPAAKPPQITHSLEMAQWLIEQRMSLAYTSYETGRLVVVGVAPGGMLHFSEQNYTRAMGIHFTRRELYLASLHQIWRLSDMLQPGEFANNAFDCVLVPRTAHSTGYLDVHELGVGTSNRPIFVASRYSCLAIPDPSFSFQPVWKPRFISALAPDDRCHLNGLAMAGGVPRYVTAFSSTDESSGWRSRPHDEGIVIDVESGEIIASGLSMPHSPRLHQGSLFVLESGRGRLVQIDIGNGSKMDVAFCPGYVRGLAFHHHFAIVGVSRARESSRELPLHAELAEHEAEPWCGVMVVDLKVGLICNYIRYHNEVTELFDVAILPDVRNPTTVGPATEEMLTTVRYNPEFAPLQL